MTGDHLRPPPLDTPAPEQRNGTLGCPSTNKGVWCTTVGAVMSPYSAPSVDEALQRQLRDLVCLAVVGDHVRWVLRNDDELRNWLAEAVPQWRDWAERVAMRLVASQVPPDARVRSLAKDTQLNWVPAGWLSGEDARSLIAERLGRVAEWARYRHSQAQGTEAELLGSVAAGLEAQLCVQPEKRGQSRETRTREEERGPAR
jgi:hypothetical protein